MRPDLVDTRAATIYEIKPGEILGATSPAAFKLMAGSALPQLLSYRTILNFVTPLSWSFGMTYIPGVTTWPGFSMVPGWTLVTFDNYSIAPGVILHDFVPSARAFALEAVSLTAAVALLANWANITAAMVEAQALITWGGSASAGRVQVGTFAVGTLGLLGF
jgi:hypothetical protein